MALFVDSLSHTEQLKDVVAYIRALTVARDGAESDDAVASKFAQLVADAATKSAEVLEFVISQGSLSFSHGSSESGTFVHDPTLSLRAFGSTMHRLVRCRVACYARALVLSATTTEVEIFWLAVYNIARQVGDLERFLNEIVKQIVGTVDDKNALRLQVYDARPHLQRVASTHTHTTREREREPQAHIG